jgi:hypothetical protein
MVSHFNTENSSEFTTSTSKFNMHKLSRWVCRAPSSLAACSERRYHSGYKDLSIGVSVEVPAGSQAEHHVTENFQSHPKKVS